MELLSQNGFSLSNEVFSKKDMSLVGYLRADKQMLTNVFGTFPVGLYHLDSTHPTKSISLLISNNPRICHPKHNHPEDLLVHVSILQLSSKSLIEAFVKLIDLLPGPSQYFPLREYVMDRRYSEYWS
jgi:hypothetical protein